MNEEEGTNLLVVDRHNVTEGEEDNNSAILVLGVVDSLVGKVEMRDQNSLADRVLAPVL